MHNPIILLIEGKGAGNHSLAPALEKATYAFQVVHTGSAAFAWIEESGKPDLVILDVSTMRSSGTRTCRRLRRMLGEIPIIHSRAAGVPKVEVGADIYLQHPYTPRKLLNRVRALLPVNIMEEEVVYFGPMTLYREKPSVEMAGRGEQQLTPKLACLLDEFLRHPEEVISRRQLMVRVWKTDYVGDTRTLDVHVRWMRECIEVDPADPQLLQTVRGEGYVLRVSAAKQETKKL